MHGETHERQSRRREKRNALVQAEHARLEPQGELRINCREQRAAARAKNAAENGDGAGGGIADAGDHG